MAQIRYLAIPIGYALWDKTITKLDLAAMLLEEVMPVLAKRQCILLFDSWYAKRSLIEHALAYNNLDIICNARCDTALYDLPASTAGRRGRPPKYGKKLSLKDLGGDTNHFEYRINKLCVVHRQVKTRIFGDRKVNAYVTLSKSGSRRLFFSTLDSMSLHMSIAWQENKALHGASSKEMKFYPLHLYKLRWGIETNYYEQKMFWNLSHYMVRKRASIEHMMNLTNVAYATGERTPAYRGGSFLLPREQHH